MSTDIGVILGRVESNKPKPAGQHKPSKYFLSELHITRFWGGDDKGSMLQLTITNPLDGSGYIQLDKSQIKQLTKILTDYEEYESD